MSDPNAESVLQVARILVSCGGVHINLSCGRADGHRQAGMECGRVSGQGPDVVADRVFRQRPGGFGAELPAEVDLFPPGDQLVVHRGEPVEREAPQRVVQVRVAE
jgi:hypothetical protein